MPRRDDTNQQHDHSDDQNPAHRDDRRSEVKPTDNPRPSSPEPEADAVQAGEEQLERVKPY